jgi:hypothetical protein
MATSWKSQQSNGEYALQFETDSKEKYRLVEKAAMMAVSGKTAADYAPVVRCKDCKHLTEDGVCFKNINGVGYKKPRQDDFCSYGERRTI